MMRFLLAIFMALSVSVASASWLQPVVGAKMYINYVDQFGMTNAKFLASTIVNIDKDDNTPARIAMIKATGRPVICYFSAGSWEDWRSDAAAFPASVKGLTMDGWIHEKWLDIRSPIVLTLMKARIDDALDRGCDAVDPDNTDGWDGNATGFPLTQLDTQIYLAELSNYAHSLGLGIGLKNNPNITNLMFTYFDFSVSEQCYEYNECNKYRVFPQNGKPVFQIEYKGTFTTICSVAATNEFDGQKKSLDLNNVGQHCP